MKKALIVWGGWEGHEPEKVSGILASNLRKKAFDVEISNTLDSFKDADKLKALDLIIPEITMSKITPEQLNPILEAVKNGTGIAGVHGGMGDSFRNETEYQFMVGGQWVAHPGGIIEYDVDIVDDKHAITAGLNKRIHMKSEQYYMHVDPVNHVLATTKFAFNGAVMPVAWTKTYGNGKVFYCSLGHVAADLENPDVLELIIRGMVWAAKS